MEVDEERGAWRWMGKRGMEVDEERGAWRWMKSYEGVGVRDQKTTRSMKEVTKSEDPLRCQWT